MLEKFDLLGGDKEVLSPTASASKIQLGKNNISESPTDTSTVKLGEQLGGEELEKSVGDMQPIP